MKLANIILRNFRCFHRLDLNLDASIVFIEGKNGTGKTTILEAIHYLCYLKSFRASTPKDLVLFGQEGFFVKSDFYNEELLINDIQVGFSKNKKLVRVNNKIISSYKELMNSYNVVTLIEDDLNLIKYGPEMRRSFIDQAILLNNNRFIDEIREFKKILENRNALLQSLDFCLDSYEIWSKQLWDKSKIIRQLRIKFLEDLENRVNKLVSNNFDNITIKFQYNPKNVTLKENFEEFRNRLVNLIQHERRFKRSLFGIHLDDFTISFKNKKSKLYASRGQQKLIILLIKIAQLQKLSQKGIKAIFLLDDFMTDFDEKRLNKLIQLLYNLENQLIFTGPTKDDYNKKYLLNLGAKHIRLSS